MKRPLQGKYVTVSTTGEKAQAFVPAPLPPRPPIHWTAPLRCLFDQAMVALGRLDGASAALPDSKLFLYLYVKKEAEFSSKIEGTQSSLSDLLLFEQNLTPSVPLPDVREVSHYIAALERGLHLINAQGLPLCRRVLCDVHSVLLAGGRGSNQPTGTFRRIQNWIGGTGPANAAFVPPPANEVDACMSALERFLNDQPESTPILEKAALAHVQLETIHPFTDGNGRLGRLLITLLLCEQKILRRPLLYLSLYFKTHRQRYYALLNHVRSTGDWESWLRFFAEAVMTTATQAVTTTEQLNTLFNADRDTINTLKRPAYLLQVHQALISTPITTSQQLVDKTGATPPTINKALKRLQQLGIIEEMTGQKRHRVFKYASYLNIMERDLPDNPAD